MIVTLSHHKCITHLIHITDNNQHSLLRFLTFVEGNNKLKVEKLPTIFLPS